MRSDDAWFSVDFFPDELRVYSFFVDDNTNKKEKRVKTIRKHKRKGIILKISSDIKNSNNIS